MRRRVVYGTAAGLVAAALIIAAFAWTRDSAPDSQAQGTTSSTAPTSTASRPSDRAAAKAGTKDKKAKAASTTTTKPRTAATIGSKKPAVPPTTARSFLGHTAPPAGQPVETTPRSVVDAYVAGFNGECDDIWRTANSDGVLVDIDDPGKHEFIVDDCRSLLDTDEADYYENAGDARAAGREDAYSSLDEIMWGRRLANATGNKIWTSPLSGG
jgi:hypothetical protein